MKKIILNVSIISNNGDAGELIKGLEVVFIALQKENENWVPLRQLRHKPISGDDGKIIGDFTVREF